MSAQSAVFRSGSLDESKPGDPLAYISASRLKSFLACRLKFYFEKVLGLKPPASPALQVGKAVHAALQSYNLARWRRGDTSPAATLQAYDKAYGELEAAEPVDYGDSSRQDSIDTGSRVLDAFLGSELARDPAAFWASKPICDRRVGICRFHWWGSLISSSRVTCRWITKPRRQPRTSRTKDGSTRSR